MSNRPIFQFMTLLSLLAIVLVAAAQQSSTVKKVPAKPTSASSGQEMFDSYCISCHGKNGKGDGPAASALKIPPPDLTQLSSKNDGKFPSFHVYQVIKGDTQMAAHGSKDMPVWGPVLLSMGGHSEAEMHLRVNNLKDYIESIQAK